MENSDQATRKARREYLQAIRRYRAFRYRIFAVLFVIVLPGVALGLLARQIMPGLITINSPQRRLEIQREAKRQQQSLWQAKHHEDDSNMLPSEPKE